MSLCSETLFPWTVASICSFPTFPFHFWFCSFEGNTFCIISHVASTPPPSWQHWQNQVFCLKERARDFSPCKQSWELWHILWLPWKGWTVVYTSVVSAPGNGAILIAFSTWGGRGYSIRRTRRWGVFYWLCITARTGLDFAEVPPQASTLICLNSFILFKLHCPAAYWQPCWPSWVYRLKAVVVKFVCLNIPLQP